MNILYFSDAVGSYAENQRITAVRKVFQRGVVNPMINIEALWKDYGGYENVSNFLLAQTIFRIYCCNLDIYLRKTSYIGFIFDILEEELQNWILITSYSLVVELGRVFL